MGRGEEALSLLSSHFTERAVGSNRALGIRVNQSPVLLVKSQLSENGCQVPRQLSTES